MTELSTRSDKRRMGTWFAIALKVQDAWYQAEVIDQARGTQAELGWWIEAACCVTRGALNHQAMTARPRSVPSCSRW